MSTVRQVFKTFKSNLLLLIRILTFSLLEVKNLQDLTVRPYLDQE
jgi:hypothetical protein